MTKMPCKGKTTTGAPCRAPAGASGLCFFHSNPARARSLGQIGGRKNRRTPVVDLEVPDNMTTSDLSSLNGKAIRALLLGELGPRKASALVQLINSMYRILPAADLEARLARLEQQLEEQFSQMAAPTDSISSRGERQLSEGTDAQREDENTSGPAKGALGEIDPSAKGSSS